MEYYLDKENVPHAFDPGTDPELLKKYIEERGLTKATAEQIQAVINRKQSREELIEGARKMRDDNLIKVDKLTLPLRWEGYSEEVKEAFRVYRISLLDITSSPGFPENITWPTLPVEDK